MPNSKKSYAMLDLSQRLCRWGFSTYAVFGGISPLNCTIFDPSIFLIFSAGNFFHIFPTRLKSSIMSNSTSVLKGHTGATQAFTRVRKSWFVWRKSKFVHYYRFSAVFVLWHKADFAHF